MQDLRLNAQSPRMGFAVAKQPVMMDPQRLHESDLVKSRPRGEKPLTRLLVAQQPYETRGIQTPRGALLAILWIEDVYHLLATEVLPFAWLCSAKLLPLQLAQKVTTCTIVCLAFAAAAEFQTSERAGNAIIARPTSRGLSTTSAPAHRLEERLDEWQVQGYIELKKALN